MRGADTAGGHEEAEKINAEKVVVQFCVVDGSPLNTPYPWVVLWLRIRDLREDNDLSQAQVAEQLKVHQTTYSDYELGRLNIPVSVLHTLADYYGVSVDYLLGRTDVKTPYPKLR